VYTPPHFLEDDISRIDEVIDNHPLATLVAATPGGLVANHLPLIRRGESLIGHCALANPMHRLIEPVTPVMAIFHGPEGFISPNWYPSKAETHKAVPTWNYRVVHVHGRLVFSHADADKRRAVSLLTARQETLTHGAAGWRMGDAPADYLQSMLDGIVAFRLEIERIDAKSKLSQNRAPADQASVTDALESLGAGPLAEAMRRATGR
jgi:transcriptional regulator